MDLCLFTATYLINSLPTLTLDNYSPFEKIFQKPPNYISLRVFGYLCYPWLTPYTKHKLESKSKLCFYLGPLRSQSGFNCFDLIEGKLYQSRHVEFVEHVFPYQKLSVSLSSNKDSDLKFLPNTNTIHIYSNHYLVLS